MVEDKLTQEDKPLLHMHNLGVVNAKRAKKLDELAAILSISLEELKRLLGHGEEQGYVESTVSEAGEKMYYLSPKGIIKVCSCFS
jgi:DNA-binding transcriptional regulator LsrR (DeoR family)